MSVSGSLAHRKDEDMKKSRLLVVSLCTLLSYQAIAVAADQALEQRLQRLERRVGHITELMLEVQALKRTNRELQGQVEEQQHALERLRRKQRELYLDLDERLNRLQGSAVPVETASPEPQQGTKPSAAPVPESSAAAAMTPPPVGAPANPKQEQADYAAAYALLHPSKRRYKDAIAGFMAFLANYPQSELADNALYWLGESYYVTQDNKSALATFDSLLKEFPDSDKAPGALLKKGYILDAMGKREEARKMLQQVLDKYPSSSVASMAKARLKHMSKTR
ncbi:MAG TPA: tol-pal system protein YbgF [Thiolapillus brandeum]|uniref:Cell division coordinator CpoB n=1 Tax=Thiolapillus brandeum TaxID=1076588 RepID=A0A831NZC7_9GAMM|nr:tol-pal system protein YbgF [Thiolapillus brandeum]